MEPVGKLPLRKGNFQETVQIQEILAKVRIRPVMKIREKLF